MPTACVTLISTSTRYFPVLSWKVTHGCWYHNASRETRSQPPRIYNYLHFHSIQNKTISKYKTKKENIVTTRVDWSKASIRYDHAHVIFLEIYSFHLYKFFKKLWKKCFSWLKWVFSFCCLDDDLTAILSCICMAAFIFSIILCVAMWSETWFQHV